jgi:probable HAF family extracellular repeat protein
MKAVTLILAASLASAACEAPVIPRQEAEMPLRPALNGRVESISLVDLGILGGDSPYSWARDVNESGEVVGASYYYGGGIHAFRWTSAEGMIDLGDLGYYSSEAYSVNNLGHIVGESYSELTQFGPLAAAFLWTQAGGMVNLGTLGGEFSSARGINERDEVVGMSQTRNGTYHAFIWSVQDGMRDLGTLGGTYAMANAINDFGTVVGFSTFSSGINVHAFSWTAEGGMVDLGTLGGCCSGAHGVNNLGHVVGWSTDVSGIYRAFIWTGATGMQDLRVAGVEAFAYGINDLEQIVGTRSPTSGESVPFFRSETAGSIDLPINGGISSAAWALNGRGQVAGWADNASQPYGGRASLWTIHFTPPTSEERLLDLQRNVNNLVQSGLIRLSTANPLLAKLDAVNKQLNVRDYSSAERLLDAFIAQVDAFVRAGLLSRKDGDSLILSAQEIQSSLHTS